MQVTRITNVMTTASRPAAAATASATGTSSTGFDRQGRIEAIRSEMRNAIAFTAKAHHGWGGPDPTPDPDPVVPTPTPVPTTPAPTE